MTIRVHALEDSGDHKPWGDGYAPQVVLTESIHELNTDTLPFGTGWLVDAMGRFQSNHRTISGWYARYEDAYRVAERYFRIFWGMDVSIIETRGYSKGDRGVSLVFATPEWLEMTGAPGVRESDHNDFCAWLWGDVYEVFDDEGKDIMFHDMPYCIMSDDGEPVIIYGMDEAMKYGEITFPTRHTYTTYEY